MVKDQPGIVQEVETGNVGGGGDIRCPLCGWTRRGRSLDVPLQSLLEHIRHRRGLPKLPLPVGLHAVPCLSWVVDPFRLVSEKLSDGRPKSQNRDLGHPAGGPGRGAFRFGNQCGKSCVHHSMQLVGTLSWSMVGLVDAAETGAARHRPPGTGGRPGRDEASGRCGNPAGGRARAGRGVPADSRAGR